MNDPLVKAFTSTDEDINFDDIPEITDFSGFKKSPRISKIAANAKAAGIYYTRAFDFENGKVEIKEIDTSTHKVLSSKIVNIDEVPPSGVNFNGGLRKTV